MVISPHHAANKIVAFYRNVLLGRYLVYTDDLGIPVKNYWRLGPQRNPVVVSYFALKYYEEFIEGENAKKTLFLNCADWLVDNLSDNGAFSVWEYKFPWARYKLTVPWVSGLAQGLGVQVLALAHKLTSDEDYLDVAVKALNAFTITIGKGGVLCVDRNDEGWWYEEYASPNSVRSYVINGHISALEGAYEFYKYSEQETALEIFKRGIEELKNHLHEYDTGSWTYYDLLGHVADWEYHKLHIKQMHSLWKITDDELFLEYHRKWKAYAMKLSSKVFYKYSWRLANAGIFSARTISMQTSTALKNLIQGKYSDQQSSDGKIV